MPYSALAVANSFIDIANANRSPLSPMKLQKLVYYAHGWHLALYDSPLLDERIEAWNYGPVIPSLYHEFKHYGNNPIPKKGEDFVNFKVNGGAISIVTKAPEVPKEDQSTHELLNKIWEIYGGLTAKQIASLTHRPEEPWAIVMKEYNGKPPKNLDIDDNLMKHTFEEKWKAFQDTAHV